MNELIAIKTDESGKQTVNARDLHEFLESKQEFANWIKNRIADYGFTGNQDYVVFDNPVKNPTGGRPAKEYHLTIDMAKELSMVERNEKGKQARLYFIECERRAKDPIALLSDPAHLRNLLLTYSERVETLELENETMKPKALFADAVSTSKTSILVGEMAKLLKQNGVEKMGQNRFFAWLRENGYLIKRKGTDFNMPTQRSMDLKLFEIKQRTIVNPDDSTRITKTPKVTGKGQQYFINLFLSEMADYNFPMLNNINPQHRKEVLICVK